MPLASVPERERIKRELGFDLVKGDEYRLDDRQYRVTHIKPEPAKEDVATILDFDYTGIY